MKRDLQPIMSLEANRFMSRKRGSGKQGWREAKYGREGNFSYFCKKKKGMI